MSDPPARGHDPRRFLGVDLAAQPEKSSLCVVEWDTRPRVVRVGRPATDDAIVEHASTVDGVGIDCPFGWPSDFVDIVRRHHDGESIIGSTATPRELRLRTTDRWIRTHHVPRDPLSVSTDRLGIVALRGIRVLERIAGAGADRSGADGVYETYPGGSLAVWGLPATGYKGTDGAARREEIVAGLEPHVDLGGTEARLVASDDDLDAVISAVVAGLAWHGATTAAPPDHRDAARIEGWIHVPVVGLDRLPALAAR